MLSRLSFIGRLLSIVFALLICFVALAVAISFVALERRQNDAERFPIPAQVAAIVELLDRTTEIQCPYVLKAVSTERFIVTVVREAPNDGPTVSRMPAVEWLVTQYLETLSGRSVRAYLGEKVADSAIDRLLERLYLSERKTITIQIALKEGNFAIFQLRGETTWRIFGIPAGFWLGLLGCVLAALAMWAIVREARPLSALARSVERFSQDGRPRAVDPQGAHEIRYLIKASNEMQSRIAALLKGRTMLLGAIGHDLKTYVTRLRLRAEFIEPADQQQRAVRDLDDMTALIDNALSLARGTLRAAGRESIDLHALIADEAAKRPNENITVAPIPSSEHAEKLTVQGDPVALRSVIANLLDNAARHASNCHALVYSTDCHIAMVIEDDGPGVAETEREAVFEPFYRLDPSRSTATGGSGLGLAIVKQIVEAHGGSIQLDTSKLGGARFRIFLPRAGLQSSAAREPVSISPERRKRVRRFRHV